MKKKIGIILMIIGLAVLAYVPATWLWGYWDRRGLEDDFFRDSNAALASNRSILDNLQGAAEAEKIRQLALVFNSGLKSEQPIARLEIPKLGLTAIIVEGTSDASLRKGPGHLEMTPIPGLGANFAVAGDRVLYGGPFLNLDELAAGDEILVKTSYAQFSYTVTGNRITTPEDVSVLDPLGYELITLITCDPPWGTSKRLVVQGKLVSASLIEEATASS